MKKDEFSNFFYSICEIKQKVVKLNRKELQQYKKQFFELNFPDWRLNLIWEFFWDDKPYEELYFIFSSKNLI